MQQAAIMTLKRELNKRLIGYDKNESNIWFMSLETSLLDIPIFQDKEEEELRGGGGVEVVLVPSIKVCRRNRSLAPHILNHGDR
jgi:hypothetical protein